MAVKDLHAQRNSGLRRAAGALMCSAMVWLTSIAPSAFGALNDPFPMGYAMGNFGTIIWSNGVSGRQPWMPAAFLAAAEGFGMSVAGVDYYDDMDNFGKNTIRQASLGAWGAIRKLTIKAAYTHFNALDMYREQKGFLSVGTCAIPHIAASAEISGCRAGLVSDRSEYETVALAGATIWIPWSFASFSLSCSNLLVKDAHRPGFSPPLTFTAGIHTAPHRFGAQGVSIGLEPGEHMQIRFRAGEEYWIQQTAGLGVALSTNPLMVGFEVTICMKRRCTLFTSLVHHPALGWSKGIGTDFAVVQ